MGDMTKNFSRSEFACRCCGKNNINSLVVEYCQRIRDAIGQPIHIECGTRCAKHNAELSGSVPNSAHIIGLAADIYAVGMNNRQLGEVIKQLYLAEQLPALQYCYLIRGKTNTGVHFDIDASKKAKRGGKIFAF